MYSVCNQYSFFQKIILTFSITANSISDAFPRVVIYYFNYSIRYEVSPTDNKCPHCYLAYGIETLISLLQHFFDNPFHMTVNYNVKSPKYWYRVALYSERFDIPHLTITPSVLHLSSGKIHNVASRGSSSKRHNLTPHYK